MHRVDRRTTSHEVDMPDMGLGISQTTRIWRNACRGSAANHEYVA